MFGRKGRRKGLLLSNIWRLGDGVLMIFASYQRKNIDKECSYHNKWSLKLFRCKETRILLSLSDHKLGLVTLWVTFNECTNLLILSLHSSVQIMVSCRVYWLVSFSYEEGLNLSLLNLIFNVVIHLCWVTGWILFESRVSIRFIFLKLYSMCFKFSN